jgi:hypothetical protein
MSRTGRGVDGSEGFARSRPSTSTTAVNLIGFLLLIGGGVLIYLLVAIWPAVMAGTAAPQEGPVGRIPTVTVFAVARLTLDQDSALLLLVILAGALGSFVHVATSFSTFVGNQRFELSWTWWYALRPLIGAALALLVYLALRGGVLSAQAGGGAVNPYGIAALASLVGLFSKQAADKLREVFETMFRTSEGMGDDERTGKATFPRPRLFGVEPDRVGRGRAAALRLKGEGFVEKSAVRATRLSPHRSEVVASQRVLSDTEIAIRGHSACQYPTMTGPVSPGQICLDRPIVPEFVAGSA